MSKIIFSSLTTTRTSQSLYPLYLNKECYEIEIAASGTEALQLFEESFT